MTDAFVLVMCIFAFIVAPLAVELVIVTRRLRRANGQIEGLLEYQDCVLQMYVQQRRELRERFLWMRNAIVWINLMEALEAGAPDDEAETANKLLAAEPEATQ